MDTKKISKVTVQYDNGAVQEISASTLPEKILSELSAAGSDKPGRFLLMEWQDGWREVIKVPENVSEVNRYYVMRRVEESGRLVIDKSNQDYPELIEIIRKPRELKRVTLV